MSFLLLVYRKTNKKANSGDRSYLKCYRRKQSSGWIWKGIDGWVIDANRGRNTKNIHRIWDVRIHSKPTLIVALRAYEFTTASYNYGKLAKNKSPDFEHCSVTAPWSFFFPRTILLSSSRRNWYLIPSMWIPLAWNDVKSLLLKHLPMFAASVAVIFIA